MGYKLEFCSLLPSHFVLFSLPVSPLRLVDLLADILNQGVFAIVPMVERFQASTYASSWEKAKENIHHILD